MVMAEEKKEERKKVNMHVDLGREVFYANNITVFNNQNEFIIDFSQTTPRMDLIEGKQVLSYVTKHNAVILSPLQAKVFLQILKDNIDKYESQFGKIQVPKRKRRKKDKLGILQKFSSYIG